MEKVKQKALTFDDVLLLPRYSDFIPSEASTQTKLTKNITIKVPLVSAAMDTVTESSMAIALAEVGGIGIIHKNNSIEEQVSQVKTVKKYESGVVRNPITIESDKSIGELIQLTTELNISGMPVVDNNELKDKSKYFFDARKTTSYELKIISISKGIKVPNLISSGRVK